MFEVYFIRYKNRYASLLLVFMYLAGWFSSFAIQIVGICASNKKLLEKRYPILTWILLLNPWWVKAICIEDYSWKMITHFYDFVLWFSDLVELFPSPLLVLGFACLLKDHLIISIDAWNTFLKVQYKKSFNIHSW